METAIARSTLPCATLCHVVCTLVATGITGINVTNSIPATTPTLPQEFKPLPEGYVAHSDIGVAYKVHGESVSWIEAKERCIREGARLALIDSTKKIEYLKHQKKSADYAHVGIVRRYDTTWVDDTTGDELASLPWGSGYPANNAYDCVYVQFSVPYLFNYVCSGHNLNYICEIPITVFRNNSMTVN